jgi:hypothetical protein
MKTVDLDIVAKALSVRRKLDPTSHTNDGALAHTVRQTAGEVHTAGSRGDVDNHTLPTVSHSGKNMENRNHCLLSTLSRVIIPHCNWSPSFCGSFQVLHEDRTRCGDASAIHQDFDGSEFIFHFLDGRFDRLVICAVDLPSLRRRSAAFLFHKVNCLCCVPEIEGSDNRADSGKLKTDALSDSAGGSCS